MSQKREDQLAHLNLDIAPASPAAQSDMPALNRENSVASVSSICNLPPDTQKFLKFAGQYKLSNFLCYLKKNCPTLGLSISVKTRFGQITILTTSIFKKINVFC